MFVFGVGCESESSRPPSAAKAGTATEKPADKPNNLVVLSPDAPELHDIKVEPAALQNAPADEVTAQARVEVNPNRVAHAALPVAGRVARVLVKLGDPVTEGQPLLLIESQETGEAEAAFSQSELGVRQAELTVAKSDADLSRVSDLVEHQALPQKELLAARTAAEAAKTALENAQSIREQARHRLELLGLTAGKHQQQVTVRAPIAGKVIDINVVAGEYHSDPSKPLITIADLSRVWVSSQVPESAVRYCKVGGMAELELIAYPGERFRARVTRIADTVEKETRTIEVIAEMDNPGGRLRPEMFGKMVYAGQMTSLPWVPESSVVEINGVTHVFIEKDRGRFLATPVELGQKSSGGFSVKSGLHGGDRVAVTGGVYLKAAL